MLYTKVELGVHYSLLILNVTKLCVYACCLSLQNGWVGLIKRWRNMRMQYPLDIPRRILIEKAVPSLKKRKKPQIFIVICLTKWLQKILRLITVRKKDRWCHIGISIKFYPLFCNRNDRDNDIALRKTIAMKRTIKPWCNLQTVASLDDSSLCI